jgi:hypothetical protein
LDEPIRLPDIPGHMVLVTLTGLGNDPNSPAIPVTIVLGIPCAIVIDVLGDHGLPAIIRVDTVEGH